MAIGTEKSGSRSPWGGRGERGLGRLKELYSFWIPGRPITKKNSGRYCGAGRLIPSKAYKNYEAEAVPVLKESARKQRLVHPIDRPVWVEVVYYMPNRQAWPDLVGLMQATADLLEAAGVLENDRLIVRWDGTRIGHVDKKMPGASIGLMPLTEEGNYWEYHNDPLVKGRVESGYYEY